MFEVDRLPARDYRGHVWHPDTPRWDKEGDPDLPAAIAALGFAHRYVELCDDPNGTYAYDLFMAGDENLRAWSPMPPRGAGWRLAAIWECEQGPIALFVRPSVWLRLRNWFAGLGKRAAAATQGS